MGCIMGCCACLMVAAWTLETLIALPETQHLVGAQSQAAIQDHWWPRGVPHAPLTRSAKLTAAESGPAARPTACCTFTGMQHSMCEHTSPPQKHQGCTTITFSPSLQSHAQCSAHHLKPSVTWMHHAGPHAGPPWRAQTPRLSRAVMPIGSFCPNHTLAP
jgi:hypothetical protein